MGSGGAASLQSLLESVVADLGLGPKLLESRALLAWAEVAGPALASQTKALRVQRGRMEVAVPSAVWRTHLSFVRQDLVERLNQRLGQNVVRELVLLNQR